MSQLINASICYTDLVEKLKAGHSSGKKAANGKIYVNLAIWVNDEADQYGNHASIQLNSTKEKRDAEGKVYIGNGKIFERAEPEPVNNTDFEGDDEIDF